jgi:hypothetical protein
MSQDADLERMLQEGFSRSCAVGVRFQKGDLARLRYTRTRGRHLQAGFARGRMRHNAGFPQTWRSSSSAEASDAKEQDFQKSLGQGSLTAVRTERAT